MVLGAQLVGMIYKCFDALRAPQSHLSSSPLSLPRISFDCPTGGCFQLLIHVPNAGPITASVLPFPPMIPYSGPFCALLKLACPLSCFLYKIINILRATIVSIGFIAYSQDLVQCLVHHK